MGDINCPLNDVGIDDTGCFVGIKDGLIEGVEVNGTTVG